MTKFFISIAISLCIFWGEIWACTGFVAESEDAFLIGNNEDYDITFTDTVVRIDAGDSSRYGCVLVGFGNQDFSMGGINDQGLFYDWFSVPGNSNWTRYPDREEYPGFKPEDLIEVCATVDEAIEFFYRYNLEIFHSNHVFLVDISGKAAVVEWGIDDLEVIWKTEDFFVTTNFYLAHPEWGWYPCWRYNTATDMLANSDAFTWQLFREILDTVHMNYSTTITQYSNIYDLNAGYMSFFNHSNFHEYINFSFDEELSKGDNTYHIANLVSDMTLLSPEDQSSVSPDRVEFLWSGKANSHYILLYSSDPDFSEPASIKLDPSHEPFPLTPGASIFFLGTFAILVPTKKRKILLPLLMIGLIFVCMACSDSDESETTQQQGGIQEFSSVAEDLAPNTTYYWKVVAFTEASAALVTSETIVWSFTTSD